jgi:hypothetical protein
MSSTNDASSMALPFDSPAKKIKADGLWCIHEFAQQLDAMMVSDRFQGVGFAARSLCT